MVVESGEKARRSRTQKVQEADDFAAILILVKSTDILIKSDPQQLQALGKAPGNQSLVICANADAETVRGNIAEVPHNFYGHTFVKHHLPSPLLVHGECDLKGRMMSFERIYLTSRISYTQAKPLSDFRQEQADFRPEHESAG
jgi:hypothetical protein